MSTEAVRTPAARSLALLGALVTGLALLAVPARAQEPTTNQSYIISPQQVQAVPLEVGEPADVTPARVEGITRFETAAAIATLTYEQSDAAVLVTGQDYPDALAASYAAGRIAGPIVLTARDRVPVATMSALEALGAELVVIVGGTGVVTTAAEEQLIAAGYGTQRVGGATRFETAAAVATRFGLDDGVGTVDGDRTAILASGEDFADALSAGPLAAAGNLPLLLTPTAAVDPSVTDTLEALQIERIIVVGGTAAVSPAVVQFYADRGYEMERLAGADRTETAVEVAQNAIERFEGFSPEGILLARGDDYPDALAASVHSAVTGAPIVLSANPTVLSPATEGWLLDTCPDVAFVRALGGTGAVSVQALGEAVAAAGRCLGDAPFEEASLALAPATYDDGPVDPNEHALFPCGLVVVDDAGAVRFTDADGDGFADGVGDTDTGAAYLSRINGVEQPPGSTRDRGFDNEGYTWHIGSAALDCAVSVLWEIGPPGNETELPVDATGSPTVRFGIGIVAFVEADG